jgi:dUTP pyrophosphatase
LKNYPVCDINIEISTVAKQLEKEYSTSWAFNQDTPIDGFFDLRACIIKPITVESGDIVPIPTGIYPQLKTPNFRIICSSHTDVVYDQGLALADGISTFEYSFRNEIWLLIQNKYKQAQTIQPTQKIATFSVNYLPRIVFNYVDQIEEISWKNKSAKSYIQKIKKKLMPDIYDVKKPYEKAIGYTRESIDKYLQGGISTGTIYKRGGDASIYSNTCPESSGGESNGS